MRSPLLIIVSCLTITFPVAADLDHVVEEPPNALRAYAAHGDPASQYNLAIRLQKGTDGKPDPAAAVAWYRKAAEAGLPEAQNNLAVALLKGEGCAKDEQLAAKWFAAAASQGLFEAQKTMIECYAMGRGVELNAKESLRWDFIARRTLELRFHLPAGEPHHPVPLTADQLDPIGPAATFEPDGTLKAYGDGRHVERYSQAAIVTTWPDGRRTVEADGATSDGESTRVLTKYNKDGDQVSQRFRSGRDIIETLQDGSQLIEQIGQDDKGRKVRVIHRAGKDQERIEYRLIRADGVERDGDDVWTVTYWRNAASGRAQQVCESFGAGGLSTGAKILKTELLPGYDGATGQKVITSSDPALQPSTKPHPQTQAMIREGGTVQSAPDIKSQLDELPDLERDGGYFPGLTDAQFEEARTLSQAFVSKLPITPQKASSQTSGTQRSPEQEAPPPVPNLIRTLDDRSAQYPVGLYGSLVLHRCPWKHAETPNFVIHYLNQSDAEPVFRDIESAFLLVTQTLQIDLAQLPGRKSHVFIFPDQLSWNAFKKTQNLSASVAGYAYKGELLLGAVRDPDAYTRLIHHEATHAIVYRFYPGRPWPLWLAEGFAEYIALKSSPAPRLPSRQPPTGQFNVEQLLRRDYYEANPLGSTIDLELFYAGAEHCVRTLLDKLPADAFPNFTNLMIAGNPPDVALKEAYGKACPDTKSLQSLSNSWR